MLSHKRLLTWAAALTLVLALVAVATQPIQAQTFKVLYDFTGGADGAVPYDGLTIDRAGNLYGTAEYGGKQVPGCLSYGSSTGCGAVFKFSPVGSSWVLTPLYNFAGGTDYGNPTVGVTVGPDGALYGVLSYNPTCHYLTCGKVYRLRPPPSTCRTVLCSWNETVLHQFTGAPDGSYPTSPVIFDTAGNIYGTTTFGGNGGGYYGYGTAYQLTPSNGGWTENVIYSFGPDDSLPSGPLALDAAGNLYGTVCDGSCYGAVWRLAPSQSGWTYNNLYYFNGNNGAEPGGLVRDRSGNLYGYTLGAVGNNSATVFELTPSDGGWTYSLVYDLGYEASLTGLTVDSAGNPYGVNSGYPFGLGFVFELARSGGSWTYTDLHDFRGSDGESPYGAVVIDANGNLFGTTSAGGRNNDGVIFEITP
jgi:uncharacterized repeat protein (TIGR03803 family)